MTDKLKVGGKIFINTRKAGEEKTIKDKIELDSPREVLVKRNGKIAAYQRFFIPQELKEWVESELGEGFTVEIANNANSGTNGLAAVVVTKNNESPAKGKTSESGQPISNHKGMANASLTNVSAKIGKNAERANRLNAIISSIEKIGEMAPHEFLHEVVNAMLLSQGVSTDGSRYAKLGGGVTLRLADHYGNASNFKRHKDEIYNYGLVIKLSKEPFKSDKNVDYLEYVYFPDKLTKERQIEIANGLKAFIETGRYELFPKPDKVNPLGKFNDILFRDWYGGNSGYESYSMSKRAAEAREEGDVLYRTKETAPKTASVRDEHQPTVVSSADGAKVLKDLDNAIEEYGNKSSHPKTLLGDIAKVLGAKKHGSNSQYATFEAVNGKVFTIRLANHNATVSTFDNHDENEGISIVVTAQENNGVTNDGNAHLVEFFYDAIKLRKADGKPLVEILKSIKQALYSGEYRDTTGLAIREEVNGDILFRDWYGGNSGYEGYSMSKRAAEAREEGDVLNREGTPATEEFINASVVASNWGNTHKGAAPCIVIQSAETLRAQLEQAGFSAKEIADAEKDSNSCSVEYFPTADKVVIYNINAVQDEIIGYLWHENAHKAIGEIYTEEEVERAFKAVVGEFEQEVRE